MRRFVFTRFKSLRLNILIYIHHYDFGYSNDDMLVNVRLTSCMFIHSDYYMFKKYHKLSQCYFGYDTKKL